MSDTIKDLESFWDNRAKKGSTTCEKVESGRRAQCMRFESFLVANDLRGASVLDVGCGVGDFWAHLNRRDISCNYLGVDISSEMIAESRRRFPQGNFEKRNILTDEQATCDYVVAFAIHNIRMPGGEELLRNLTLRQFELCNMAAHVDILTDRYSGTYDDHIKAWKPEEILGMALDITPHVALRHDYLPNSFSITLYRKPMIDTRQGLLLD